MVALLAGCGGKPSAANIALRKENQQLRHQIEKLKQAREVDAATIAALEGNATTLPVLPRERTDPLFTVHDLKFGRLTGGADLDRQKPGDEALKVYVVPVDRAGDALKAAGAFTIEAFDLNNPEQPLLGRWTFTTEQARESWYGDALLYTYVLTCPWQTAPQNNELTIKVRFVDELTQREFDAQRIVRVRPANLSTNRHE